MPTRRRAAAAAMDNGGQDHLPLLALPFPPADAPPMCAAASLRSTATIHTRCIRTPVARLTTSRRSSLHTSTTRPAAATRRRSSASLKKTTVVPSPRAYQSHSATPLSRRAAGARANLSCFESSRP
eukprot:scaffold2802_cov110-Isochrysis_galbana.AAC.7